MRQTPNEFHIDEFKSMERLWGNQACVNGKWVPARPLGLYGIRHRIALAWDVLTGKADALYWEGQ